jgi:diguanylate cyclase (GGDEF)-like protein
MASERTNQAPRILIVDDEEDQRLLIAEALRIYYDALGGDNVVAVGSAEQCLAQDLPSFDVILLDYHLPDMGGLSLLEQILGRANVPVVFVTGENDTAKAVQAIDRGAMDYIVKLGDYLFAIPAVVKKCMRQHLIKQDNLRLQQELEATCEQLRIRNVQLQESLEKLRAMADTDHLTGLRNRRCFAGELNRYFGEAIRYGFDLTCCMCDLDHYKQLNDTLGHQLGDEVLVMAADVVRRSLRSSDIAARYGGDEIVLLLPHTSLSRGMTVAKRVRRQLERRSGRHARLSHSVTISIGIASLDADHPTSGDVLVSMADRALYVAKSRGKDQIVRFGDISDPVPAH